MSFNRLLSACDRKSAQSDRDPDAGDLTNRPTTIRVPSRPNLTEAIGPRVDLEHGIYFCSGSSKRNFSGHIDSRRCMQEKEIVEFVRYSHPELYQKLDKMPLPSTHLRDGSKDASSAIDGYCELSCDSSRQTTSVAPGVNDCLVSPANKAEPNDINCPSEPDELDLAIRAQVPVYFHCQLGVVFCCGAASCSFRKNVIPEGGFFTLVNGTYYCLDCVRKL